MWDFISSSRTSASSTLPRKGKLPDQTLRFSPKRSLNRSPGSIPYVPACKLPRDRHDAPMSVQRGSCRIVKCPRPRSGTSVSDLRSWQLSSSARADRRGLLRAVHLETGQIGILRVGASF